MDSKDFRAKQFMPFDALSGFYDLIDNENIEIKQKLILSDDSLERLNKKFQELKKGDNVLVKYYYDIDYIETTGIIKKIDTIYKNIYILNSVINIDDIIDIKKL